MTPEERALRLRVDLQEVGKNWVDAGVESTMEKQLQIMIGAIRAAVDEAVEATALMALEEAEKQTKACDLFLASALVQFAAAIRARGGK